MYLGAVSRRGTEECEPPVRFECYKFDLPDGDTCIVVLDQLARQPGYSRTHALGDVGG